MAKVWTVTLLVSLVCSLSPVALQGQADAQQVVLVRTAAGLFVAANPDGTQSTTKYVVPEGQELCLTDIVWIMSAQPNQTLDMSLVNANVGGTSDWRIWTITATMGDNSNASGMASFRTGPKITSNGAIQAVFPLGLSGAAFTLYGKQRASSTAPCS